MYGSSVYYKKRWLNLRENLPIICLSLLNYTYAYGCEGFFKGCCPGSTWNSISQQCERCFPGYTGEKCSVLCPYPYYGVDCQRTCNCSRDKCDVSSGCMDVTTSHIIGKTKTNNDEHSRIFSKSTLDTHTLDIEESDKYRPGYIGKYCRARCIYPYFGKECEAECNCSEPMCDVATGCGAVDRGMTPYVYDETVCFILLFLIHSQPILFQHSYF
eukprot:XP_011434796.1 PREDICTED: multiple epidermal growth factor-like domains protein 10 isoform X1 [Crassostrea gigas]